MPDLNFVLTIATSAGVGAFVSSFITLFGQYLERRSRREELLLQKAIEMAKSRTDLTLYISESMGKKSKIYDEVFLAETYYQWLKYLLNNGKLPPDVKEKQEKVGYGK